MLEQALAAVALLVAAPAAADTLLIGNKGEDTLSLVDLAGGRELRRLPTGRMPHEIALSPDGRIAAVVSYGGRSIELFDVARGTRLSAVDLGAGARPHGLVWLADGRLVATAEGTDALMVIAPDGAVRRIATGQQGTHMVAVTPDGRRAWTANMRSGSVSEIDLSAGRKLRDVKVGREPEGIALSRDGRTLWVADRGGTSVHVLDTASGRELAKLPTGKMPIRVAMSADGARAFVSNFADGSVGVYDAAKRAPLTTWRIGGPGTDQVTMLVSGKRLYVAETARDTVAEVDVANGRVLRRLPAGRNGDGLALSPVTVTAKEP